MSKIHIHLKLFLCPVDESKSSIHSTLATKCSTMLTIVVSSGFLGWQKQHWWEWWEWTKIVKMQAGKPKRWAESCWNTLKVVGNCRVCGFITLRWLSLGRNCKGITRHCTYWWQSSSVLKTDHSPSMFPPLDVTTRVLPLTEHKRGLFPPFCKSEPPAPGPWRLAGPHSGPPWRERERERETLVWTNVRASSGARTWNEEWSRDSYLTHTLLQPRAPSPPFWAGPNIF